MEVKGRLVKMLPVQTGQGKNGEWKKQEFILETEGTYPKKVCISVWGDKVNMASFSEGSFLTASVDIASREFNGKWYTDVTAWKVEPAGNEQPGMPPMPPPPGGMDMPPIPPENDDMPF